MGAMLIFFEGELIVRDDLKYPEGVLLVGGRNARRPVFVFSDPRTCLPARPAGRSQDASVAAE
jgi:hypothetical protein